MPQDPSRSVEPQIEKLSRQLKWVLALTILIPLLAISYLVLRYVSPDMLPREGGMVILAVLLSVGAGARVILHLVTKAVRASSRATGQREAEGQPPRDEDLRSDRRSIRYKVAEAIALVGAIPFLAQGYIVVRYVRPGNTTENLLLLVFFVTVVLLLGLTEINQLTRRILRAAAAARMVRMETGMPRLDCGADELGEISTDLDSIASTLSKRAEQLVHTREFMFSIIEHLPHPLVSYDTAGAITIANSAATALLGYTTDELIGRDIGSLFCKKGDAWGLLAKSREEAVEVRWRRKDGSELPLSLCSAEMRGAGNEPSVVLVGTDLSERKHLEDELRQAHKMEAMGLLAGGIAHDFNNILTAIKGNLYLINQVNEPETQRECYLENLHESVERASSLVNQLLAFSRKQILESRVLNINMVISGMDKLLRRLLGEDIEIVTILRPGLGNIRADKGQMEQVIINLAINARDAMPRGGKLVIQTDNVAQDDAYGKPFYQVAPGPQVRLTVADNGCGMSHTVKS
ncbi:MAG: PAS domain S-box protein, partial [Candidatus Aureabacteria bacterium]|nr:PAS domain S-box protein [Candidatus Auribacterota bacterium]